jgi:hypothetical protein
MRQKYGDKEEYIRVKSKHRSGKYVRITMKVNSIIEMQ